MKMTKLYYSGKKNNAVVYDETQKMLQVYPILMGWCRGLA